MAENGKPGNIRDILRRTAVDQGKVDKDQVVDCLQRYWMDQECPICKSRKFVICDEFVQPVPYPGTSLATGAGYPMVMLVCGTCGYTLFFNAVKIGLVKGTTNVN